MMSAPRPSAGSRSASHSRRARYDSAVYQCRPMRFRTRFEPDCSGACRCAARLRGRSEEHTSELQSLAYLVCRLLLEKKKKNQVETSTLATTCQRAVRIRAQYVIPR